MATSSVEDTLNNLDQFIATVEKDLANEMGADVLQQRIAEEQKSMQSTPKPVGSMSINNLTNKKIPMRPTVSRRPDLSKKFVRFNHNSNLNSSQSLPILQNIKHPPLKSMVCPPFLNGNCIYTSATCNMLHTYEKKYMPHCYHYLNHFCSKQECPYLHVNLGKNIDYCPDFTENGFCEKGKLCKFYHANVCSTYIQFGKCTRPTCFNQHPGRLKTDRKYRSGISSVENRTLYNYFYSKEGSRSISNTKKRKLTRPSLVKLEKFTISKNSSTESTLSVLPRNYPKALREPDFSETESVYSQISISSNTSDPTSPGGDDNKPYFGGPETNHEKDMQKIQKKVIRRENQRKSCGRFESHRKKILQKSRNRR